MADMGKRNGRRGGSAVCRRLVLCIPCLLGSWMAGATPADGPPPICPAQAQTADPDAATRYECANSCAFESPIDVEAEALVEFEKYEGRVPYMYLDTRSNVTVGIGDMLPDSSVAVGLPFVERPTTRVDDPVIATGFTTVASNAQPASCDTDMSTCHGSSYYGNVTDLILGDDDIDTIARGQIAVFGTELEVVYPDFDGYPSKVQLALYDMIFNLGQTKLQKNFPSFDAAIMARDWQKAADESHRSGIQQERNDYVRNLLEEAAGDSRAASTRLQQCPAASSSRTPAP